MLLWRLISDSTGVFWHSIISCRLKQEANMGQGFSMLQYFSAWPWRSYSMETLKSLRECWWSPYVRAESRHWVQWCPCSLPFYNGGWLYLQLRLQPIFVSRSLSPSRGSGRSSRWLGRAIKDSFNKTGPREAPFCATVLDNHWFEFSCFHKAIGSSPSPRSKAERSGWTRVDRARKRFPPSFSSVHFHAAPL